MVAPRWGRDVDFAVALPEFGQEGGSDAQSSSSTDGLGGHIVLGRQTLGSLKWQVHELLCNILWV